MARENKRPLELGLIVEMGANDEAWNMKTTKGDCCQLGIKKKTEDPN